MRRRLHNLTERLRDDPFRRQLTTGLWTGLLAVALVTTGGHLKLSAPSPDRLRFAHTFTTASERAIIDAAIAEFGQTHPGIQIEQSISNSETYQTVGWRLQFQGRRKPDIFFHWQGFKVEYAVDHGWALDVTPFLRAGFLDEFIPATVHRQNGGIYHLPQSVDISNLIWYNRDLFGRLRLQEPSTLGAWLHLCVELRRGNLLPLAQGNRDLWPMGNFGAELMGQALGVEGLKRLFQPGVVIAPGDLRGLGPFDFLAQQHCFDLPGTLEPGAIGALTDIDAKVLFLGGKSAQHAVGSWLLADVQDARNKKELSFPVGLFPVPADPGQVDAMTAVTTGYLVNPESRNPRAAVEFIELLLSRKYQGEFAKLGNLSVRRDAGEFTTEPLAKRMLEILRSTPVVVPPPDTGYRPEQANIFYELCARLLTGKLTLAGAADYWDREKAALARKGL